MKLENVDQHPSGQPELNAAHRAGDPSAFTSTFGLPNPRLMARIGALILPGCAPLMSYVATSGWHRDFWEAYVLTGMLAFFILYPGRWVWNRSQIDVASQVLTPWSQCVLVLAGIGIFTGYLQYFSYRVLATWIIATPIAQILALYAMPSVFAGLVRLKRRPHRIVVVGANPVGRAFAVALASTATAHSQVVGFFDDRHPQRLGPVTEAPMLGKLSDLGRFASQQSIDQVFISLPLSSQARITTLLNDLRDSTASIYFLPDLFSLDLIQPRLDTQVGFPVVAVCESPFSGANSVLKRGTDLLIAGLALVICAIPMMLIALAIKLTSPGPVIFKQRRFGLDGGEIQIWKFRSMSVTEDGSLQYTQVVRGDPRVTRLGAVLRRTSLDELPQLINVLQGRMSIVGPRPHALRVNDEYRRLIPGYMVRHKVRPGITGWAQVNGFRGGDDLASMTKRVEYDLAYLRRWSIWLDIRIMFRTIGLLFRDAAAF